MKSEILLSLAAASMLVAGLSAVSSNPAQAGRGCLYRATNGSGWSLNVMATGRNV